MREAFWGTCEPIEIDYAMQIIHLGDAASGCIETIAHIAKNNPNLERVAIDAAVTITSRLNTLADEMENPTEGRGVSGGE